MTTLWVQEVEKQYLKTDLPDVKPGDTIKVKIKIKEGNKERLQAYEGVVVKLKGAGLNRTVTVRRVFQGVGVERVFLLHSPRLDSIQIIRKGRVRRAKLYYLRELTGKAARIREKIVVTTAEEKAAAKKQRKAEKAALAAAAAQPKPEPAPEPVAETTPDVPSTEEASPE